MKRAIRVLMVMFLAVSLVLAGCGKKEQSGGAGTASTQQGTQTGTDSQAAGTQTGEPQVTATATENKADTQPGDTDKAADAGSTADTQTGDADAQTGSDDAGAEVQGSDAQPDDDDEGMTIEEEYQKMLGTWYVHDGEIDGYQWEAVDEGMLYSVTFHEDYTADVESGNVYEYDYYINWEVAGAPVTVAESDLYGHFIADLDQEDATYYYCISDGDLICLADIFYDEGTCETIAYYHFTREQPVQIPEPRAVPESIKTIMDGAGSNNWITVIADPDESMVQELIDAGWTSHDETNNEWLADEMFANPAKLIVCNTGDRGVMLEVHEPLSGFDPSQSDTDWVPGPFMYYEGLEPGEITSFIVNMPENPREANMALYMFFEGDDDDEPYYMRVYRYGFNYFAF